MFTENFGSKLLLAYFSKLKLLTLDVLLRILET